MTETAALTLSAGGHEKGQGKACVMEYVALLAGVEWTDYPPCTNRLLARAAQIVNDKLPDSNRHLLIPLIGSLYGTDAEIDNRRLALWCARSVEKYADPTVKACNDATEGYLDGHVTLDELRKAWEAARPAAARPAAARPAAAWAEAAWAAEAEAEAAWAAAAAAWAAEAAEAAEAALIEWLKSLIAEYDRLASRTPDQHRVLSAEDIDQLHIALEMSAA